MKYLCYFDTSSNRTRTKKKQRVTCIAPLAATALFCNNGDSFCIYELRLLLAQYKCLENTKPSNPCTTTLVFHASLSYIQPYTTSDMSVIDPEILKETAAELP